MADMSKDHTKRRRRFALALAGVDDQEALLAVLVAMILSRAALFLRASGGGVQLSASVEVPVIRVSFSRLGKRSAIRSGGADWARRSTARAGSLRESGQPSRVAPPDWRSA